jgi:hypothetical protein
LRLTLVGRDEISARIFALAREAGYRCVDHDSASACPPDTEYHDHSEIHVLVTTDATPSRTTSRHQRLIDLRPERRRHATPDALLALRDLLAVDGLIAAMGMGRDSFHPRFLLNPEVCPLSCC